MEKLKFITGLAFIGISLIYALLIMMDNVFSIGFGDLYYLYEKGTSPIFFGICAFVGAYLLVNSKFKK